MKLVFHSLVEEDIQDAVDWYESKSEGLGEEFILSLYKSFSLIESHPLVYEIRYAEFRVCLIDRFPYTVHYKEEGNHIFVSGVWHASRNPARWLGRI